MATERTAFAPDAAAQHAYWRDADAGHFRWQTAAPYIAATEAALLDTLALGDGERLLEVGCGEGGNLHHLARRFAGARLFGSDFSSAKAAFARQATGARTVRADAHALPFCDGAFDALLVRDLLHHVTDRGRVLAEAHRVLRPGGRLLVVEPNGRSPLVLLQAATVKEERGVLVSTAARLREELARAGFRDVRVTTRQPLPVSRVLLHPTLGRPQLGARPSVARALAAIERAARLLPAACWTYLVCNAAR